MTGCVVVLILVILGVCLVVVCACCDGCCLLVVLLDFRFGAGYWFGSCPIFMVVCVVGDLLFWLWLVALLWSFRGLLGGLVCGFVV